MGRVTGKVWLVTGASSGIGRAVAYGLAKEGGHLILLARRKEKLIEIAQDIFRRYKVDVLVIAVDLTDNHALEHAINWAFAKRPVIHGAVHCAGYGLFKEAVALSYEDMRQMLQINTLSAMHVSQLLTQQWLKRGIPGHLTLVASSAGKIATPASGVYSASKSGIISYANSLRMEVAHAGIQVTVVNPGPVRTAFFSHEASMQAYLERVYPLALEPDSLAQEIIQAMGSKRKPRELNRPSILQLASQLYGLFPIVGDFVVKYFFNLKEG
ncbi:hypothetical protein CL176_07825 [Suicoccus acidiformans]|uniref:Ketoreductase domain-containing protein n=1 Tax=Suicoccus acidiformans TaxID=2036206 RepID=A0A347WLF5_9LACT|nr:SDR family NAD(P)-dependent oxidoreductase [Suicoccus acidiformans]AXY25912.1 hypothetical protein CL176_07825 [Suicoccus acidiformans]